MDAILNVREKRKTNKQQADSEENNFTGRVSQKH